MSTLAAKPPLHPLGLANKKRKLDCRSTSSTTNKKAKQESEPITLRCVTKDLNPIPTIPEIDTLRQQNTDKLLRDNKLTLILDLDNTLLHTADSKTLTQEEELTLQWDDDVLEWGGHSITKLRPHVRTFLKEASKMYDMYIYTMAGRAYAKLMAEYLDPEGIYFNSKVLSRDDCTERGKKGLDVVLVEERAVVIIDDNKLVWDRHSENLCVIDRYCFFGCTGNARLFDIALMAKLHALESIHQFFFSSCGDSDQSEMDVRDVIRGMVFS